MSSVRKIDEWIRNDDASDEKDANEDAQGSVETGSQTSGDL